MDIDSFNQITQLAVAQEDVKQTLESIFDGLWHWNLETKEFKVSKGFWELFGIENSNKPDWEIWTDVILQEDRRSLKRQLRSHFKNPKAESIKIELRGTHKNKSTVWLFCNAKVMKKNSDGRVTMVVGSFTDITSLKVEQRKADINLRLAAIAEMAGNISHEINNPLAIANISVDWIAKAFSKNLVNPENISKKIVTAKNNIKRASSIIEGLRLFTNADFDSDLKREKHVHNILDVTLSFITPRAQKHNIRITNVVDQDLTLFCNESQVSYIFHSILSNIISTLRQHSGGEILISSHTEPDQAVIRLKSPGKFTDSEDGLNVSKSILESQLGSLRLIENENSVFIEMRLPAKHLKAS